LIRWLLWNLRCLRGRRCANLVVEWCDTNAPQGTVIGFDFTCAGCGTDYRQTVIVGEGEEVIQAPRVKQ
jgi:hypothetical protein